MSTRDPASLDNNSDWQLLAEFLISDLQETEAEIVDHVADVLHQYGLDPGQLGQIQTAISHSLRSVEGAFIPLRLRISVSGVNLAEAWPETCHEGGPELDQGSQLAGGGLGFFLVKRLAGQLQEPGPKRYRLVEVLLYRE